MVYAPKLALRFAAAGVSAIFLSLPFSPAVAAEPSFSLKAGQEVTFAANVEDGKVVVGPAKLSRLGQARPGAGEITVGLTPRDKELYSQVMVTENTTAPVDFVATGHIGEIVIDERVIEGHVGAPFSQHIGGVSWTVVLRDFTPGKAAP